MKIQEELRPSKEEVSQLQQHVMDGDELLIDQWFAEMNLNETEYHQLTNKILNGTNFFMFQSTSVDMGKVKSERERREIAILKHLPLKEQIDILGYFIDKEYFSEIHYYTLKYDVKNKKHQKMIKDHKGIHGFVTGLFNKEKFTTFENIEKFLGLDLLQWECGRAMIFYREKNSHGSWGFSSPNLFFKPYYDIVFNYSDAKKVFLNNRNIPTLSKEEVEGLREVGLSRIDLSVQNEWTKKEYNYIMNGVDLYISITQHDFLNENLPINSEVVKKAKL